MKNIISDFRKLRVIIVTHEYATGPTHALEKYLRGKVHKLAFIAHPFVFAGEKRSHMRFYKDKSTVSKEIFFPWYAPLQSINIIKDVLMTLWWCIRFGPVDLYVGADNVNACVGVILQKIGLVKITIFYTIDYIPHRFENPLFNSFYHFLDRFAVYNATIVWNLSAVMDRERARAGMIAPALRKKQIVVPMGTDNTVAPAPFDKMKRFHLAHMGHLTKKQGVQLVIEAIPFIVKRLPQFHFDVIGGGPMESVLRQRVNQLHINRFVTFYGFIENHDEVELLLAQCALSVAPYVDTPDNFVRYGNSGKLKAYLAVGLPIVLTKVPDVWKEIVDNKAGIAVADTPEALAEGIVKLLSDEKRLREYRENAVKLGQKYAWANVFTKAFTQTLRNVRRSCIT